MVTCFCQILNYLILFFSLLIIQKVKIFLKYFLTPMFNICLHFQTNSFFLVQAYYLIFDFKFSIHLSHLIYYFFLKKNNIYKPMIKINN